MNPLKSGVKLLIDPWVKMARAAYASPTLRKAGDATLGRSLRLLGSGWKLYWDFGTQKIPQKIYDKGKAWEAKGEALCHGKNAPRTIVPGLMLRRAGKVAKLMGSNREAYMQIAGILGGIGVVLASMSGFPVVAVAVVAAGFPALVAVTAIEGTALVAAIGVAASVVPALCNIPTGFKRRQEAFDCEEQEKSQLAWEKRQKLPALERDLYRPLEQAQAAPPHERIAWFESLKASFPDEFAAAARLDPGEAPYVPAPVQPKKMVIQKKPRLWDRLRHVSSR